MAEHSPAPWRRGQVGNLRIYAADEFGEKSGPIAEVLHRHDPAERAANARLIAAAPALQEACQRAKGELQYMAEKMPHTNARDALEQVKAALSLTEGERK